MLQEKQREFGKELHVVFVDLEKAYDRVPGELIMVLAQTKGCSRGLHKHNPGHVCWVQEKRHDQCGKD